MSGWDLFWIPLIFFSVLGVGSVLHDMHRAWESRQRLERGRAEDRAKARARD